MKEWFPDCCLERLVDFPVASLFAITTKFTLGSFTIKSFGLYRRLATCQVIGFQVIQALVNRQVIGMLNFDQMVGLAGEDKAVGMAIVGRLKQPR